MAQDEIIEYLKANKGRWVDVNELSKNLNLNKNNIILQIKLIRKNMKHWQEYEIDFRKVKNNPKSPYDSAGKHIECRFVRELS